MLFVVSVCFLLLLLVYGWYYFWYAPFRVLQKLGIRHPPVVPFMGNASTLLKVGIVEVLQKWRSEYGKTFGYYVAGLPHVVITDLDMLKEITVKHFDKFRNKYREPFIAVYVREDNNSGANLIFQKDDEWKYLRNIVTPTFTSKKLRLMMPLIEKSCDALNVRLDEISSKGQSIDIQKLYAQYAMQTILAIAFGSKVNLLNGEWNKLTEAATGTADSLSEALLIWESVFYSHCPTLLKWMSAIGAKFLSLGKHGKYLNDTALQIIKSRRENNTRKWQDFLQLLIDARAPEDENKEDDAKKHVLTDKQIGGFCLDFLVVGFDTTSNALAFTSYLLALNPNEQEHLREAIEGYYQENEDASLYDAAQNIPYLDWVIQESLRMYSPSPF